MEDSRLNSMHLGVDPRRERYRQARTGLHQAAGMLTWAGERLHDLMEVHDGPQLVPCNFVLYDPAARLSYILKVGLNTVGRFENNDIVLNPGSVSRRHGVILVHARGGCDLHDTASRNGTYVNGVRLRQPVRLTPGDRIEFCRYQLLFYTDVGYRAAQVGDPCPATDSNIG